jgi:hypothetical protein
MGKGDIICLEERTHNEKHNGLIKELGLCLKAQL